VKSGRPAARLKSRVSVRAFLIPHLRLLASSGGRLSSSHRGSDRSDCKTSDLARHDSAHSCRIVTRYYYSQSPETSWTGAWRNESDLRTAAPFSLVSRNTIATLPKGQNACARCRRNRWHFWTLFRLRQTSRNRLAETQSVVVHASTGAVSTEGLLIPALTSGGWLGIGFLLVALHMRDHGRQCTKQHSALASSNNGESATGSSLFQILRCQCE